VKIEVPWGKLMYQLIAIVHRNSVFQLPWIYI